MYQKVHCLIGLLLTIVFALPLAAQSPALEERSGGSASTENTAPIESAKPDKRLFGVLPNYRTVEESTPFERLTARQKLTIAKRDSFDWPTFPTAAFMTFAMSGKSETDAYGGGWSGFANRYARNTADQIIGNMLTEGLLPAAFHHDPRYFRIGSDGTFWSRLRGSLLQIAVSRDDKDHKIFNVSEFLGNAMAVGVSNSYSPNLNSWPNRGEKWGLMIGTDMFSNVIKEFGPDVKQHLFHRHHQGT